jgi:hypothetical protein
MDFLQSLKLKIVNDKLKILKINSFNRAKLSEFSQIKFIKNEFWKKHHHSYDDKFSSKVNLAFLRFPYNYFFLKILSWSKSNYL